MATFYVNLKKQSFEFFQETGGHSNAWLLSSHRAKGTTLEIATERTSAGERLMADNGTIEFIRETNAQFEDTAKEITDSYRPIRRNLPNKRRTPFMTEVPDELREKAVALFNAINLQVNERFAAIEPEVQTDIQLSMQPSSLIAREDWAIAAALGLGMERELLGFPSSRYVTRNRQSIRGYKAVMEQPESADRHVFCTLGATDYTTARAAGREAALSGIENAALGFAGLNADNTYTEVTYFPRRHNLNHPGPRRYVRLAEITLGFRDGYRDIGEKLKRFHALGLGARVMWPILTACLDEDTAVSVDATSAIKDAEGGVPVLYHPDEPHRRIRVTEVAGRWIRDGELPFESPLLQGGLSALGGNRDDALTVMTDLGLEGPTHESLRTPNPLSRCVPLFANGAGTSRAGLYLAHHNYWASIRSIMEIPDQNRVAWSIGQIAATLETQGLSLTVRNGLLAVQEIIKRDHP